MNHYLIMIVFAVIIDRLIGDPRSSFHPVVLIGNLISFLEKLLLNPKHTAMRQKISGAALVAAVLAVVYGTTYFIVAIIEKIHPFAALFAGAALVSFTISPRSLAEAGREIADCLSRGDMATARSKVGYIVGRDTAGMDAAEVTRATVETVAENIVDGVIAPLFYAVLGGAALAFLYRAVNTLDSMVGYKNEKYKDFGMVAARVDDIFNYIPARITGILIILAAWALRRDAAGAARIIWRDAAKHPSPNSGLPEAAVAGALGIRLGGLNFYGGLPSFRSHMGDDKTPLRPEHIGQTNSLMYLATGIFLFFTFITFIAKQVLL